MSLYRVGESRQAVWLRTIPMPEVAKGIDDVALSGGDDPVVCVSWSTQDEADPDVPVLQCFPPGGSVAGVHAQALALNPGATRVAWLFGGGDGSDQSLSTADYAAGRVSGVQTQLVYTTGARHAVDVGCPLGVRDLTWAGSKLLLECKGQNGTSGALELLASGPGPHVREVKGPGATGAYLPQVGSADETTALGFDGAGRAVRFDLATGRVLEVIATPAPSRFMISVGGGSRGVVYRTGGTRNDAVYLRFPGDKHGTRITGLPFINGTLAVQP